MDDTKIANALQRFIDCRHAIGEPSRGYDCYNFLLLFYRDLGVEIPTEHRGWSVGNYKKKWETNVDEGREILGDYLRTLGEKVDPHFMRRGDLLIFKGETGIPIAGIACGNGHVFIVFAEGGRVCPLKFFRRYLVECRRLLS